VRDRNISEEHLGNCPSGTPTKKKEYDIKTDLRRS
jgi:hypothetical protein